MSGCSCGTWDLRLGMWDLLLWHGLFFVSCPGFSLVVVCGFSLSSCGAQAPGRVGSVVVAHRLSCPGACGILVPRPGIEPASPALEGGFFTTGPPGKSPLRGLEQRSDMLDHHRRAASHQEEGPGPCSSLLLFLLLA